MDDLSRRGFMQRSAAFGLGFSGLASLALNPRQALGVSLLDPQVQAPSLAKPSASRFGPLVTDKAGLLDLPEGFTYKVLSKTGETMADGLLMPGKHDGMAAFAVPGQPHLVALIRNHEIEHGQKTTGAFGEKNELLSKADPALIYDRGHGKVHRGGCSTTIYDTREQKVVKQWLSLVGTVRNCAGGPTPWGSWISCEENDDRADTETYERAHGYAFEVPVTAEPALAKPEPLRPMGRFYREAVAIDPKTGIVYQSEDQFDAPIYRFIPKKPGELRGAGRLEALAIVARPRIQTSNHERREVEVGTRLPVEWIPMEDVEAIGSSLRSRAVRDGAARFARGEGMWATASASGEKTSSSIYWACTEGGSRSRKGNAFGQLWKYNPSVHEGTDHERTQPGTVELIVEPNNSSVMDHPDNITASPWGDLIVCEDGGGVQYLLGVTPAGEVYRLAKNAHKDDSEFAGAAFSPDGSTLFVNIQTPGYTLAITGPWKKS
jgi:uncharacterized protein